MNPIRMSKPRRERRGEKERNEIFNSLSLSLFTGWLRWNFLWLKALLL